MSVFRNRVTFGIARKIRDFLTPNTGSTSRLPLGKCARKRMAGANRELAQARSAAHLPGPPGKRLVGDKTVLLSPKIVEEIGEVFPEAKVIHIVRDGRDVAVSSTHHRWNQAEDQDGIGKITPDQLAKREAYRGDPRKLLVTPGSPGFLDASNVVDFRTMPDRSGSLGRPWPSIVYAGSRRAAPRRREAAP